MNKIDPLSTRAKLRASQEETFPYQVHVEGVELLVHKGVYSPKYFKGTDAFVKHMTVRSGERWLDMGTSIGPIAIHAALRGAREVHAVDVNPLAVENARTNVITLGLTDTIRVYQSDLFGSVPDTFDTISFNQPLSSDHIPATMLERAVFDQGYYLSEQFLEYAPHHLRAGGRVLMGASPMLGDIRRLRKIIREQGYTSRVVGENREPADTWQNSITYQLIELRRKE